MAAVEKESRRLIKLLVCSVCHQSLKEAGDRLICELGHGPFFIDKKGRAHLTLAEIGDYQDEHFKGINRLKSFLKRWPRLYYLVWNIFCPVLLSDKGPRSILPFLSSDKPIVINLGSGPKRLGEEFINVDVFPFEEVDVVADAHHLPFADSSVDAIAHECLLEHAADPLLAIKEMTRVIKPGGLIYSHTPFLIPYHASPDDFNRWTVSGLKAVFSDFEPIKYGVGSGPWSALLVFLAYFLGVIFSFGSKKSAPFLAFVFMLILGPLKILDYFFARLPGADAVAAHLYFIGRKK